MVRRDVLLRSLVAQKIVSRRSVLGTFKAASFQIHLFFRLKNGSLDAQKVSGYLDDRYLYSSLTMYLYYNCFIPKSKVRGWALLEQQLPLKIVSRRLVPGTSTAASFQIPFFLILKIGS